MNSPENIASLFEKYLSGSCTQAELQSLLDHFDESYESHQLMMLIEKQMQQDISTKDAEKLQNALAELDININAALNNRRQISEKTIKFRSMKWISVAAAAAIILFGAGLFYFNKNTDLHQTKTAYTNDISPGKVGATLTLANGKQIRLVDAANGEIAKQAGVSISKTEDGQIIYDNKPAKGAQENLNVINTLSTAKGETYMLTLPDQSKVWMNAASTLTYSAKLNERGHRRVKLNGEAYFEITKDKKHPFIVESKGQQVEVLGTHFNIKAYNDEESIRTTLLEGLVKVSVQSGGKSRILTPGQQASVDESNNLKISEVDVEEIIAWKNGYFLFNRDNIREIMKKFDRWYDIEVIYEGEIPRDEFVGKIRRSVSFLEAIEMLSLTSVNFKIHGRKVIVSGSTK